MTDPQLRGYVLVTGAASGLGRAFFEHFTKDPTVVVLGIDKQPWPKDADPIDGGGGEVGGSTEGYGARFLNFDLMDVNAMRNFGKLCEDGGVDFDLIVHCAGVRGLVPHVEAQQPGNVAAAETVEVMDVETMRRAYETNVLVTFNLVQTLLPGLRRKAKQSTGFGRLPTVVIMASRMGSLASNSTGGGYAYRASKAALNAVVKSLSIDVPEVCFASVHPGRVETSLVKTKEQGAISVQESLGDLLPLIEKLGTEEGLQSGCFVDRFGKTIPW